MFCSSSVLPKLSTAPRAVSITDTAVTLQWDAWGVNPGDTGDGPVIQYIIYSYPLKTIVGTVNDVDSTEFVIESLNPNTRYFFYVTCVRPGPGGEDTQGANVFARTLPTLSATTKPSTKTPTMTMAITKMLITQQPTTESISTVRNLPSSEVTTQSSIVILPTTKAMMSATAKGKDLFFI